MSKLNKQTKTFTSWEIPKSHLQVSKKQSLSKWTKSVEFLNLPDSEKRRDPGHHSESCYINYFVLTLKNYLLLKITVVFSERLFNKGLAFYNTPNFIKTMKIHSEILHTTSPCDLTILREKQHQMVIQDMHTSLASKGLLRGTWWGKKLPWILQCPWADQYTTEKHACSQNTDPLSVSSSKVWIKDWKNFNKNSSGRPGYNHGLPRVQFEGEK